MNGKILVSWYRRHKRDLPWRKTKDPYYIWLSEIMLQQTQVKKVIPYYLEFIETFPTIKKLSKAHEKEVLRKWSGLGYYRRARNLQKGACIIQTKWNGKFPETWEKIRSIPGIGDYTASAILSLAFKKPYVVIDGNVIRVLSRLYGISQNPNKKETKEKMLKILNQLLSHLDPSDFNQAMMELGATLCTPQNPQCLLCPIQKFCYAFKTKKQDQFPPKIKKRKVEKIQKRVAIIKKDGKYLVTQQKDSKILNNLWIFPEIEDNDPKLFQEKYGLKICFGEKLGRVTHHITYRRIRLSLYAAKLLEKRKTHVKWKWVALSDIKHLPHSSLTSKIGSEIRASLKPRLRNKQLSHI